MPAIEVENLTKRYGDVPAMDDVSFTVEKGEIFGILGPNGAGKTTTVESIAGLRRPDSGTIRVLGLDPQRDRNEIRRRLGVQLQESRLPDRIQVGEALDLYSSFYESPLQWESLLGQLGLTEKRDTRFGKLSGGQKQRVSIALALVGNPEVVILDELTTGLDPQARRDTWAVVEQLREKGVTVILVTHFMEEAERLADRVALIDAGRVVALDTPAGLIASTDNEQVIRFRPSRPMDDSVFAGLAEVTGVTHHGDQIVVRGVGNVLHAVTSAFVQSQVIPQELRVEQATLDDAFLALTGRSLQPDTEEV
ncbi:MAG TPA: ABC transporter ATP-binding protein [Acidimicrobiia bacterium]|nr:ABC transporter ATP-binding protein [Acidimicrobiia bacterium]